MPPDLLPLFLAAAPAWLVQALVMGLMILAVIVLFSATVFVHEFGHYWVASKLGLRIETFSIGFGPALWKWRSPRTGVLYKLSLIPLGGYVALPQMDPVFDSTRRKALAAGKEPPPPPVAPWRRILVALAGGVMNMAFAFVLACVVWKAGINLGPYWTPAVLGYVEPGSALDRAGVRTGDRIVRIDDKPIGLWMDFKTEVTLRRGEVDVVFARGDSEIPVRLPIVHQPRGGGGDIDSIQMLMSNRIGYVIEDGPAAAAGLLPGDVVTGIYGAPVEHDAVFKSLLQKGAGSATEVKVVRKDAQGTEQALTLPITPRFEPEVGRYLAGVAFEPPADLISHPTPGQQLGYFSGAVFRMMQALSRPKERAQAVDNMGSAVAIFVSWYRILQEGIMLTLWYTALINVNLAIMNLLPFLILDGGHIMIALYEMIFRRPPHEKVLVPLLYGALATLLGVFLLLTVRDFGRIDQYLGRASPDEDPPPAATTNAPPAAIPAPAP